MQITKFASLLRMRFIYFKQKQFRSFTLLVLLCSVSNDAFAQTAASPLPESVAARVCLPVQLELFACVLKREETLALCLNKDDLTLAIVRNGEKSGESELALLHLREAASSAGAHGANIIVQSDIKNGQVTLFVNTNRFDMVRPALVTTFRDREQIEYCEPSGVRTGSGLVLIKHKQMAVNLFRLKKVGLAAELATPPEWPGQTSGH